MKIAHICQSYPPMVSGQSYMVERLAKGTIDLGHEVMVISASDRRRPYAKITGRLRMVRLASWPNPFRVGQRFALWGAAGMKDALDSFDPDVVHLHDPVNCGLAGISASRRLGIPVLLTTHALPWLIGAYFPRLPGVAAALESISWRYGRWFIRRCDGVVSPSARVAEIIKKKTGAKVRVISNGADLSRFHPGASSKMEGTRLRRQYALPATVPVILHVGRLDRDKNVPFAIRAAARAMRSSTAHLLIAGDGVERDDLIALCNELGIAGRSHFPGFVNSEGDLPGLFRLATVFVTASEIEVQSLVLLEATASGLPIVAVDATSVSELVHHGKSGYLVKSGDEKGMAAYISRLLAKPGARSFGKEARRIAEEHTFERTFAGYERIYMELAGRKRKKQANSKIEVKKRA